MHFTPYALYMIQKRQRRYSKGIQPYAFNKKFNHHNKESRPSQDTRPTHYSTNFVHRPKQTFMHINQSRPLQHIILYTITLYHMHCIAYALYMIQKLQRRYSKGIQPYAFNKKFNHRNKESRPSQHKRPTHYSTNFVHRPKQTFMHINQSRP